MNPVYRLVPCGEHAAPVNLGGGCALYSEHFEVAPVRPARTVGAREEGPKHASD
jgi:hypothetical protein